MTHVLLLGVFDGSLTVEDTYKHGTMRVVFPPNKYTTQNRNKPRDQEQDLCFAKVITSEFNTLLLEKNGDLWGFGPSPESQLGIASKQVVYPINISQIMRTRFIAVSPGVDYIIGETVKNQIYLWGNCAKFKQQSQNIIFEKRIDQDYKISAIDITEHINFSLQSEGKKVVKKQKKGKELDSIHSQSQILCTQQSHMIIPDLQMIKVEGFNCEYKRWYFYSNDRLIALNGLLNFKISLQGLACGPYHCLAWDKSGRVWSWGEYTDGKLGYIDFKDKVQMQPRLVEGLITPIIDCACSITASVALDEKGHLHFWGQSVVPRSLIQAMEPKEIQMKTTFIKVVAGNDHYGALDILGHVYCWGVNTGNCMGIMEEQVFKPTHLDLGNLKVIDISMSQNRTVLIVPASNEIQQLPQINKINYVKVQRQRIIQNTSLIRNKAERKLRLQQEYQPPEVLKSPDKNDANECYEKTTHLLSRIKTQIEQKESNLLTFDQSCISYESQTARADPKPKSVYEALDYDQVQTKIRKLEMKNPIFLPVIIEKFKTHPCEEDDETIDLGSVIQADNELLKCEYIEMVKQKGYDNVLLDLLREPQRSQTILRERRRIIPKVFIPEKEKTFQDKYDKFDHSILEKVKLDISQQKQERFQKFLEQQKIKERYLDSIKAKVQENPLQMSFAYQLEHIQQQAEERNKKIQYAQLKKQQIITERVQHAQLSLYYKSAEYKAEQKIIQNKKKLLQLQFLQFLQYLNIESICQLFVETNRKVVEMKTLQIRKQMNARIIQSAVRKRNFMKQLGHLTERQVKILESLIIRIRVYLNICLKRKKARKMNLYFIRNSLRLKFMQRISKILTATLYLQKYYQIHFIKAQPIKPLTKRKSKTMLHVSKRKKN